MKNIICVIGTNEVERSIFTVSLANLLMDKNKVLIIDFDILNNNLHEILGIKKYSQKIRNKIKNNNLLKEIKIQELIFKINYKIDLISGMNLLFDSKYKISNKKKREGFSQKFDKGFGRKEGKGDIYIMYSLL